MQDARGTLKDILAFVDGHVKFAETKNAAVLAANAAALVGIGQILSGSDAPKGLRLCYVHDAIAFAILAGVVALVSFLPRTRIPWLHTNNPNEATDSLYFFGDIQKYGEDRYVKAVRKLESLPETPYSDLERMLAQQVLINARIASHKFRLSRWAMYLTLCAALTPALAIPLILLLHDWGNN